MEVQGMFWSVLLGMHSLFFMPRFALSKFSKVSPCDPSSHSSDILHRHSAGTSDAETDAGGSNGAGMRYEAEGGDPANCGLQHTRVFLEPVREKHQMDHICGPMDIGRSGGNQGDGGSRDLLERRANRLRRRLQAPTSRSISRRGTRIRPPAMDILQNGFQ